MENNMDNELPPDADRDRDILAHISQLFDPEAHRQSQTPVIQEKVAIMIPEIYPWFVEATLLFNASRYLCTHEDTGEAFIIIITSPDDPILGDVSRYVWISFEAIHLPYHPHLVHSYIEVVNVPYFEAREFPRWIFRDLGIPVYDFLEAFNAGHDPHTPLHVRLGLPPFWASNPASLPPPLPAIPAGFHTLLPAVQPARPVGPAAPFLVAPLAPLALPFAPLPAVSPAPPAAPVAPLPVALPVAPAAPAAHLQSPPAAGNARSIAYEDLDLPKINIRRKKRKANLSSVRRMTVPLRLWEGFKQWMQAAKDVQVRANAVNREMRQEHIDGYLRFYLEEQDVTVPEDARPTEGYSVTRDFQYVQEEEEEDD